MKIELKTSTLANSKLKTPPWKAKFFIKVELLITKALFSKFLTEKAPPLKALQPETESPERITLDPWLKWTAPPSLLADPWLIVVL